jgi:hypothetical protein
MQIIMAVGGVFSPCTIWHNPHPEGLTGSEITGTENEECPSYLTAENSTQRGDR